MNCEGTCEPYDRGQCGQRRKRTHQSAEPFKGSRNSDRRVDFDQNALGGVDVDLKPPCLVEWRVEQSQEALQRRKSGRSEISSCACICGADSPRRGYEELSKSRTWCVISGRACAMSRPIFARTPWWSSQLRRLYLSSPFPPRCPAGAECLYVSRQACSSTTISLLVESFSALVLGAFGAAGIMVGFRGGDPGAGRLRETGLLGFSMGIAAEPALAPAVVVVVEGTNEGAETESDDPCFFAASAAAAAAELPLTVAAAAEVPALVDAAVDILSRSSPVSRACSSRW